MVLREFRTSTAIGTRELGSFENTYFFQFLRTIWNRGVNISVNILSYRDCWWQIWHILDDENFEPKEVAPSSIIPTNKWEGEDEDDDVKVREDVRHKKFVTFFFLILLRKIGKMKMKNRNLRSQNQLWIHRPNRKRTQSQKKK